jgi:hypothetical protein
MTFDPRALGLPMTNAPRIRGGARYRITLRDVTAYGTAVSRTIVPNDSNGLAQVVLDGTGEKVFVPVEIMEEEAA